ncbi:hypothetical protein PEBR_36613 [Penicillium brasilianum]|uniref:LysM domain-containing protein n=1 Tax=Penicillium brasilianum TaxID=104259 RepID=A0A0F7TZ53_PENBI|nr:hypothetical protein PEBR_36613 [Penicillium brasilianum]CEJ60715.1 hypothetical protein PMG11_09278 [Penicillium brasilianum]
MSLSISKAILLAIGLAASGLATDVKESNVERDASVRNCVAFYRVAAGNDCFEIRDAHPDTFTMEELMEWNPRINRSCTNLLPGQTICIRKLRKDCPSGA